MLEAKVYVANSRTTGESETDRKKVGPIMSILRSSTAAGSAPLDADENAHSCRPKKNADSCIRNQAAYSVCRNSQILSRQISVGHAPGGIDN